MLIKLGDIQLNVENVEFKESHTSRHTGNQLEILSFNVRVKGNKKAILDEAISNGKNGGVFSINDAGNKLKEYKIANHTYSYNGNLIHGETIYTYNIELEEIETLSIERLIIAGIEVIPYKYSEDYDSGIIIEASVSLTKEQNQSLLNAIGENKYFDVKRIGICDETKTMRFGKVIWSETEGTIKKNLVLVESIYDEKNEQKHHWLDPEWSNMQKELALTKGFNKALIGSLLSKGILNQEEIDEIMKNANAIYRNYYKDFVKVDDIDEYSK